MTAIITDEEIRYAMTILEDKRGPGRLKGYQHSEETKAKMSVKRQARTQPRNTTSGQFVKVEFVKEG